MLTVLDQIHLARVGSENGVEFKNLGIRTTNSLLVAVGHPDGTVIQVHPLCLVAGGNKGPNHQQGEHTGGRRPLDDGATAWSCP